MELTKEQIKRIDSFLEGIGVEYIDIRLEMVDHIATEIEEKVTDLNDFFGNKRFQTPFVKYMLSQKSRLFESYQKQVKRSFWANTKKVILDIFKELIKPLNVILILSFLLAVFFLEKYSIKYTSSVIFIMFFLSYMYLAILFNQFKKKFGSLRIIHAYTNLLIATYIFSFHLPATPIFSGDKFSSFYLYKSAFMLVVNYLIFMSYINRKEKIVAFYKSLV